MGASDPNAADACARRLRAALDQLPLAAAPRRWLVAFSGGIDSTVLLHLLAQIERLAAIVAVHVDHGLHHDSAQWTAHCARGAERLGVGFISRRIDLTGQAQARAAGRMSREAAAREARYAALAEWVEPEDVLLTAHHADDQLETVLLRLLRGTGVRGLTSIHRLRPCGRGWLARPLLAFTRAEIRAEAERLGLDWLEDPSNRDLRFDRNYLRTECLPPLLARWPRAGVLASRLADQMAEAETVLEDMAASDLAHGEDPERIDIAALRTLSAPRLNNALRFAVRRLGLPVPSAVQLTELSAVLAAREDAETLVRWPGAEARVYRGHLYLLAPRAAASTSGGRLQVGQALRLAQGELKLVGTTDYGIPDRWAREGLRVAFRQGGERFEPSPGRCRKTLKHWFQDEAIVPWMRQAVPLLYRGDRLVAVADLSLAANLPQAPNDAPFWRPVWSDHPRLR
jgi:tRNA(Ile)-lysidine synthase